MNSQTLACLDLLAKSCEHRLGICTGQEGSDTVAIVKAFIPDKWRAGNATSPPVCAATSLNFTAVCEEDADFQAVPEPISQVGMHYAALLAVCKVLPPCMHHGTTLQAFKALPLCKYHGANCAKMWTFVIMVSAFAQAL